MDSKSFFTSLFDFSFSSFITPKIIKILFIIGLALTVIFTLIGIVVSFFAHPIYGIVMLVLSPIIFSLYVLAVRIYLEFLMVLFRIQSDIAEMANRSRE